MFGYWVCIASKEMKIKMKIKMKMKMKMKLKILDNTSPNIKCRFNNALCSISKFIRIVFIHSTFFEFAVAVAENDCFDIQFFHTNRAMKTWRRFNHTTASRTPNNIKHYFLDDFRRQFSNTKFMKDAYFGVSAAAFAVM